MPQTASIPARSELRLWTADEFLDWLKPGVKADLIDGEKHMHSPVNLKHARLVNFMDRLLGGYVEERRLGEVHREVVAVRLSPRNVFMPDVAFFTHEQVARFEPAVVPFAPTFVIEVLSPWTEERDTNWKFAKYEEHGVQEYWILDPDRLQHQFFRRDGELLVEFAQGSEQISSASVEGFWVNRAWLNSGQLAEVGECLKQLKRDT